MASSTPRPRVTPFAGPPAMEPDREKIRENRLRGAARRQGLTLVKSKRRDPRALDFGTYMLLRGDAVAMAGDGGVYGLTLDQVEEALTG